MSPNPSTTLSPQIPDSAVAQRAYNRWLTRGRPAGDGREDWFAAQAELQAELAARLAPPARCTIRSALRHLAL